MLNKNINKKIFTTLKILVSFLLTIYILSKINFKETLKILETSNLFLLIIVFAIGLLIQWIMAYKWKILLKIKNVSISTFQLLKIMMIGSYLGIFFPSSLSSDVIRLYYLTKANSDKLVNTSSVIVDRIFGLLSLFLMGIIGLFLSQNMLEELNLLPILLAMTLILVILLAVVFSKTIAVKLENIISRIKFYNIGSKINKLYKSLYEYQNSPSELIKSFLLSLAVQLIRIGRFYLLSIACNLNIKIEYFIIIIPAMMIITLIPISLGGIGLKEGTGIYVFTLLGVPESDSVVIILIASIFTMVVTLLGSIFYISFKNEIKYNEQNLTPFIQKKNED